MLGESDAKSTGLGIDKTAAAFLPVHRVFTIVRNDCLATLWDSRCGWRIDDAIAA